MWPRDVGGSTTATSAAGATCSTGCSSGAPTRLAFQTALHLNNKYFLDGRDANSYANVAWVFGLHDRPWPERPVFGKVRYMNAQGLERKFDMAAYLRAVDALIDAERG